MLMDGAVEGVERKKEDWERDGWFEGRMMEALFFGNGRLGVVGHVKGRSETPSHDGNRHGWDCEGFIATAMFLGLGLIA